MIYIGQIEYDSQLQSNSNDLVIYGVGKCGKKIYEYMKTTGLSNRVKFFCDNNINKQGQTYEGVQICSLEQSMKACPDAEYLLGGAFTGEMATSLRDRGIDKFHVVIV